MRRLYTLCLLLLLAFSAQAQTEVSIVTGEDYAYDVFYSFEQGEVARSERDNWDLAFEINIPSAIRANTGAGTSVWLITEDTTQWASLDTTGLVHPDSALLNETITWLWGALNQPADPDRPNDDIGWAIYNIQTHVLTGNRLFAVQTRNGQWLKLWVRTRGSGRYVLWTAGLDGSNQREIEVPTGDFSSRLFAYLDLESGELLNREPARTDWNLLFTRYIDLIDAGPSGSIPYGVTGVLTNEGIVSAQFDDIDVSEQQDTTGAPWNPDINEIGYDWKEFDMDNGGFLVVEDRAYYVRLPNLDVWKVVFTGFSGSETGTYTFTQEKIVDGVSRRRFLTGQAATARVWPNPARSGAPLFTDVAQAETARWFDLQGRHVHTSDLTSGSRLSVPELPQGLYQIEITSGTSRFHSRVLVQP